MSLCGFLFFCEVYLQSSQRIYTVHEGYEKEMKSITLLSCMFVMAVANAGILTLQNESKCHMKWQFTTHVGMNYFDFPQYIDAGASSKIRIEQKHGTFANGEDYKGFVEYLLDCGSGQKGVYTIFASTESLHGLEYVKISQKIEPNGIVVSVPNNDLVGYFDPSEELAIKLIDIR